MAFQRVLSAREDAIRSRRRLQHIHQRGAIAVTDRDALTGGHQDHSGADFGDFGEVDDVGAVDTDKTGGGEFFKEFGETHQYDLRHLFTGHIDFQVLAHAFNIDNVGNLDLDDLVVGFEEHEIAGGGRSGTGGTIKVIASGANYGNSFSQGSWGGSSSSESKSSKGIRFEGDLYFDGADVNVTCASHEGIEAKGAITITAGNVSSTASDDALNSGTDMTINGGQIYALSSGNDGLDANRDMYVKGGYIFAVGSGSPEVALDANTEENHKLYISGGTLLAFGGIESGSSITQPVLNVTSWTANTEYSLYDGDTLLVEFTAPTKGGNGIVISHPDLVSGSSYTLKTSSGSTTLTASMEAQSGNGGGGNSGGNPGGNPGGGNPGGGPGGRW